MSLVSDGWWKRGEKVMEMELKLHSPVGGDSITYTWPVSGSVSIFSGVCKLTADFPQSFSLIRLDLVG